MEKPPSLDKPAQEKVEVVKIVQLKAEESEIRESRVFTEAEILEVLENLDGTKREDVETLNQYRNEKGEVVVWNLTLKEEEAQKRFKSSVNYNFTIKGAHTKEGKTVGRATVTSISRDFSENGDIVGGDTLAEYKDGEWVKQ